MSTTTTANISVLNSATIMPVLSMLASAIAGILIDHRRRSTDIDCSTRNSVNPIATNESASDCNMPCNGNANQPCGGANRINLFWNGQTAPPPPAVSTNPGVDGWVSEGCYTDSVGARTLGHKVDTTGGGSVMTVQLCVDACNSAGYSLAGAEYADECYWCDPLTA
jgi:hypothetical protein